MTKWDFPRLTLRIGKVTFAYAKRDAKTKETVTFKMTVSF